MLTLEQFRESKKLYQHGFPQMEVEGPCFIYDLCCFINVTGNGYSLIIGNQEWVDDLDKLEEILYQWYLTECN
jgi:hypothetical protein